MNSYIFLKVLHLTWSNLVTFGRKAALQHPIKHSFCNFFIWFIVVLVTCFVFFTVQQCKAKVSNFNFVLVFCSQSTRITILT